MDGNGGDEDNEEQVNGDGGLVHGTAALRKEDVHDDGHGERCGEHAEGRANKEGAPGFGIVLFDFLEAEFGVSVGEIY